MANSGTLWIDRLFNAAVKALYACAEFVGITYEEINVWIFCIGWLLSMIVAAIWIYRLRQKVAHCACLRVYRQNTQPE